MFTNNENQIPEQWTYDRLNSIYFTQSEAEQECLRGMQRGPNKAQMQGISPLIQRNFGRKEKFIKTVQECLNWQKPDTQDLIDQYERLIKVGHQPELIKLNKLETVDEAQEWILDKSNKTGFAQKQKVDEDNVRLAKIRKQQKLREQEEMKSTSNRSQYNRRTVTFDFVDNKSQESSLQQAQQIPYDSQLELPGQTSFKHKMSSNDSTFSKISENMTAYDTTMSKSSRAFAYTPSPTKLQRKKTNFSNVGNDIMNSTGSTNFKGLQINLNRVSDVDSQSEHQSQPVSPIKCKINRNKLFKNDNISPMQSSLFRNTQLYDIQSSRASRMINAQKIQSISQFTKKQHKKIQERPPSSPLQRKGTNNLDHSDF